MNSQNSITGSGRTGFWMRVGRNLNVRVVNGTMYRLLSGKNAATLIHILSLRFARQSLRQLLYVKRKNRRADNTKSSYPRIYGLIGLQASYVRVGLGSSTILRKWAKQRRQADMSRNTFSSQPFSRLTGLKDGNEFDTVNRFLKRRNGKQTP